MQPIPTADLRTNQGTWIVPTDRMPTIAAMMRDALPTETYDPRFFGQQLATAYFDDRDYTLRKQRVKKQRYLTLRIRSYEPPAGANTYALSAKTESEKWRIELTPGTANALMSGKLDINSFLPAHLSARINEFSAGALVPVVRVYCTRYAAEDDNDRLTLDVCVRTDRHTALPFNVLEYKSVDPDNIPSIIAALPVYPVKLSKFLWATKV